MARPKCPLPKLVVIVFGSNENSQYIRPDLDSLSVFRSSQVRNLGVLVDQHLKFDKHTLYCQKYWHSLLMNRFDYFSNFYEYKS